MAIEKVRCQQCGSKFTGTLRAMFCSNKCRQKNFRLKQSNKKESKMSDHIERMKTEHKELTVKIKALNSFIHGNKLFKTLDDIEQSRMIKQSGFMESYASVLESRIWVAI